MKKIIICLALFLFVACPVQACSRPYHIQVGVIAMDTLTSKTAIIGAPVRFRLCENLVLSDTCQLNAGTILTGNLIQVKKSSGWGCPGKMRIHIDLPTDAKKQGEVNFQGGAPNFFVQFSLLGGLVKGKNATCTTGSQYLMTITDLPIKKVAQRGEGLRKDNRRDYDD